MRSKIVSTTSWTPKAKKPQKPLIPDQEPGLPSIHQVKSNSTTKLKPSQAVPKMNENKSKSLSQKIDASINGYKTNDKFEQKISADLNKLIESATSKCRFDSRTAFKKHIQESSLLNVTKMLSNYIGIPYGEYIIHNVNSNSTVLIPTNDIKAESEVLSVPKQYTVSTKQLFQHWNKAERVVAEADTGAEFDDSEHQDWVDNLPGQGYGKKDKVQDTHSKYPRSSQTKGAIEASGKDQEDIADAIGVHPSTVSRWTAKSGEGSRLPSMKNALALSSQTGQDIESMFSVNQGPPTKTKKKTSGSGGGRNKDYTQGRND